MKYVMVGDIHGQWEIVDQAMQEDGHKVFVGDFLDSYTRSTADMQRCLDIVLAGIQAGEATAILGNHELSYFNPNWKCSGWMQETQAMMAEYKGMMLTHFCLYFMPTPDVLVTHAGLDNELFENVLGGNLSTLEQDLEHEMVNTDSPLRQVGRARGGTASVGGVYWNDFNFEHLPIPRLTQVFGHTHETNATGFRTRGTSMCIDVLEEDRVWFLKMDL